MSQRKSFLLRIDSELYDALRRWADQEMRSVNGQIEYVLRRAVSDRTGQVLPPSPPEEKDQTEAADKP